MRTELHRMKATKASVIGLPEVVYVCRNDAMFESPGELQGKMLMIQVPLESMGVFVLNYLIYGDS